MRLLRIEGHADGLGAPAYNLDLSLRRASAVQAGLVARGIAPERLQPIGSGEARRLWDATPQRQVDFLILVWDEATVAR